MLDGPVGLVFQLHGEVARLAIDEWKGDGTYRGLESREVGPKGVMELIRPILS